MSLIERFVPFEITEGQLFKQTGILDRCDMEFCDLTDKPFSETLICTRNLNMGTVLPEEYQWKTVKVILTPFGLFRASTKQ